MEIGVWYGLRVVVGNEPVDMAGCYKLTNLIDGRAYIGSSKNLIRRIHYHMTMARRGQRDLLVTRAITEIGSENFLAEPLCYIPYAPHITDELLGRIERDLIRIHGTDARSGGYNIIDGPLLGSKWSDLQRENRAVAFAKEDVKLRRKTALKAAWQNPDSRQRHIDGEARSHNQRIAATTLTWQNATLRAEQSARLIAILDNPTARAQRTEQLAQAGGTEAARKVVGGSVWITDGKENRRVSPESPLPNGWRRGRATEGVKFGPVSGSVSFQWITDGTKNAHLQDGSPMPEGWRIGRLPMPDRKRPAPSLKRQKKLPQMPLPDDMDDAA